ncbi:MAG: hypothetical protein HKN79_00170, partial [Flavobacteriales bacterium]|nr:hypothetical protein [Flavobacteriales bacterium]
MIRCFLLLVSILLLLTASAQFSSPKQILYHPGSDTHYIITLSGQIWSGTPETEFVYNPVVIGANVGQCLIIGDQLWAARIGDLKVYNLFPLELVASYDTPATEWLIGLAWDGDLTIYLHDQEGIYDFNMSTQISTTVNEDLSNWAEVKEMVYHPYEDKLVIVEDQTESLILAYDIPSNTYDTLAQIPAFDMERIDLGCDDHYLISGGGSTTGLAYALPYDLSTMGDTLEQFPLQPKDTYYDPLSGESFWLAFDSLRMMESACLSTGLEEMTTSDHLQVYFRDGL